MHRRQLLIAGGGLAALGVGSALIGARAMGSTAGAAEAAVVPGVDLILVTDQPAINRVRDLVVAGNSAHMADPAFAPNLRRWLEWPAGDPVS